MTTISFVETVVAPFLPYGADITDLSVSTINDSRVLTAMAGYGPTARLVTFDLQAGLSFSGESNLGGLHDGFQSMDYGSATYLVSTDRLETVQFATEAQIGEGTVLTDENSGAVADEVTFTATRVGQSDYLVSTDPVSGGLATFSLLGGSWVQVPSVDGSDTGITADLGTVPAFGATMLVTADQTTHAVRTFDVAEDGMISSLGQFGAADGLGINTPEVLDLFMLNDQPHVALGASGTGSISILRVEADGSMTPLDHVLDNLDTRFDGISHMAMTSHEGIPLLVASGADDGFSVFRVLDNGHLFHLDSIEDTTTLALDNIEALSLALDNSTLHIFTGSAKDVGLGHFTMDLAGLGQSIDGTSGADALSGGALGEVIDAGDGDDVLNGNGGDDLLIDGLGSDQLTGGSGRDTFVLTPDGEYDEITDFERGIDALDLSYFPMLYDVASLEFVSTATGARLSFKGETLEIISSDGLPLTLDEIIETDPFNVDRPPMSQTTGPAPVPGSQIQIGTEADNVMTGSTLDDVLSGNGGDDVLTGGAGRDQLYGGAGFDTVSYDNATAPVTLDLADPGVNTGDAAGDELFSIEAIRGSGFADKIYGDETDQTAFGHHGHDEIFGRAGQDALYGDGGNDLLVGGSGADHLDGAAGVDTAGYLDASSDVRADLLYGWTNTGDADGDSFTSIENLAGGGHTDFLGGDRSGNFIDGQDGDDMLLGRLGDDTILGGDGNDHLVGGYGGDTLDGGQGNDTASYVSEGEGISIDLVDPGQNAGGAQGDTLANVENLIGTTFDDTLTGDAGDNAFLGLSGDDRLKGGDGNDTLSGGSGADFLNGGTGDDILIGGDGADHFEFANGSGNDVIPDFDASDDTIALDTNLIGQFPEDGLALIEALTIKTGEDVLLDFGNNNSILFEEVDDMSGLFDAIEFF